MAGLPAQLNFYDLLLAVSTPVVTTGSIMPGAERAFGCLSNLPKSSVFLALTDAGPLIVIVITLCAFVLIYASGQAFLLLVDLVRRRMWRWKVVRAVDPFRKIHDNFKGRTEFDEIIEHLSPGIARSSPRTKIWAAAGFLQQFGNYAFADRFNVFSIYCFALSCGLAIGGIFNLVVAVAWWWWWGLAWSAGLCIAAVLFFFRSMEFAGFFSLTVMTAFLAHGRVGRLRAAADTPSSNPKDGVLGT